MRFMKRLGSLTLFITFIAPMALNAAVLGQIKTISGSELLENGVVAALFWNQSQHFQSQGVKQGQLNKH